MIAYEGELITIWNADAREVLPTLETESAGLVVTDPPYGVEWQSGHRREALPVLEGDTQDDREMVRSVLEMCVRLVGQNRHLYVFGPEDALDGLKVSECTELVWDKGRGPQLGNLSIPWGPEHERISFTTSLYRHAGQTGRPCNAVRLRKGTVLHVPPVRTGRRVRHPAEKPVMLLRELIESSSRLGEIVLDPFAGVGSVGVAAALLGRRAVLVETNPGYCSLAVERCAAAEAWWGRVREL